MRHFVIAALAAATFAPTLAFAAVDSEANPFWSGCVIARQFGANGTNLAIDRVCYAPNKTFSVFEDYQMGQRPDTGRPLGFSALRKADLRFTGIRSRFAVGDSRQARMMIDEAGPAGSGARYTYDLTLSTDQEAIVTMPSGISIGLRMDSSNVPTPFSTSLSMPTWQR